MLIQCFDLALSALKSAFGMFVYLGNELGFLLPWMAFVGIGLLVLNIVSPMIENKLDKEDK